MAVQRKAAFIQGRTNTSDVGRRTSVWSSRWDADVPWTGADLEAGGDLPALHQVGGDFGSEPLVCHSFAFIAYIAHLRFGEIILNPDYLSLLV